MKKIFLFFIAFCSPFLTLFGQNLIGFNYITNSSFEVWEDNSKNPKGWVSKNKEVMSISNDVAYGESSLNLKVEGEEMISTSVYQVSKGKTYRGTFMYKILSGSLNSVKFRLSNFDKEGKLSVVDTKNGVGFSNAGWKEKEFLITSDKKIDRGVLDIVFIGDADVLLDDVFFEDYVFEENERKLSKPSLVIDYKSDSDSIVLSGLVKQGRFEVYKGKEVVLKGEISSLNNVVDVSSLGKGDYFFVYGEKGIAFTR